MVDFVVGIICLKLGWNSGKRSDLDQAGNSWAWIGKMNYEMVKEDGKVI